MSHVEALGDVGRGIIDDHCFSHPLPARAEIGVLQNRIHPSGIKGGVDEKIQVAVDRFGAQNAVRQLHRNGDVGSNSGRAFAQCFGQPEAGQREVADGDVLRLLEERGERNAELFLGRAASVQRGGGQCLDELFHIFFYRPY